MTSCQMCKHWDASDDDSDRPGLHEILRTDTWKISLQPLTMAAATRAACSRAPASVACSTNHKDRPETCRASST